MLSSDSQERSRELFFLLMQLVTIDDTTIKLTGEEFTFLMKNKVNGTKLSFPLGFTVQGCVYTACFYRHRETSLLINRPLINANGGFHISNTCMQHLQITSQSESCWCQEINYILQESQTNSSQKLHLHKPLHSYVSHTSLVGTLLNLHPVLLNRKTLH